MHKPFLAGAFLPLPTGSDSVQVSEVFIPGDLLVVEVLLTGGSLTNCQYYDPQIWSNMTLVDSYSAGGCLGYMYYIKPSGRNQRAKIRLVGANPVGGWHWYSLINMEQTPTFSSNKQSVSAVTQVIETFSMDEQDFMLDMSALSNNDSGFDKYSTTRNDYYRQSVSSRKVGWGMWQTTSRSGATDGWAWTANANAVYFRGKFIGGTSEIVGINFQGLQDDADWYEPHATTVSLAPDNYDQLLYNFSIVDIHSLTLYMPNFDNLVSCSDELEREE